MIYDCAKIGGLAGRLPEALRAQAQRSGMGGERRELGGERASEGVRQLTRHRWAAGFLNPNG